MTDVVHVITDLGPTDGPGLVVPAQLLGSRTNISAPSNGPRIFYYDPPQEHA